MPADTSPESRIVEALETAGDPLDGQELRDRTGLEQDRFDDALGKLRGQEVVRKLDGTDAYRLTYWPDDAQCALCGDDVTSEEYYELELKAHGTNTDAQTSGSLHADCARTLLDELSHTDRE